MHHTVRRAAPALAPAAAQAASPRRSVRRRAAAAGLALLPALACTTWRAREVPAPGAPAPRSLRVVLASGERLELRGVTSVGDSLVGETGRPARRRAVALRDVARAEARAPSVGRTAALVAAGVGLAGLAALVALLRAYSPIA